MLSKLRPRLTYANVISSIALFVAVGGGTAFAFAAANSVVSTSIKNGEVKTPDLGANAVTSPKVAPNSITGADVNENSLGIVPSSLFLAFHPYPAVGDETSVPAGETGAAVASCLDPDNEVAVAGGYNVWKPGAGGTHEVDPKVYVGFSARTDSSTWMVGVFNGDTVAASVQAQVLCMPRPLYEGKKKSLRKSGNLTAPRFAPPGK